MSSQEHISLLRPDSAVGQIFVKNLEKTLDSKWLYDTFATFGTIVSCKVAVDDKNQSRGYAFVNFETEAAADSAIEKTNGTLLNGQEVSVGRFIPRPCAEDYRQYPRKCVNVFIKNFGEDVDDSKLLAMFDKFGKVTSHAVMKDENGKSRGFGFVCFEQAEMACKEMNGKEMNGQNLYVDRAQNRTERQREHRQRRDTNRLDHQLNTLRGLSLYVKNLDESIDDETLRKEFAHLGHISSTIVIKENGRSKGFGFVCFVTPEGATKAVQEMNGKMVCGQPLEVVKAKPSKDTRAQFMYPRGRVPLPRFRPPKELMGTMHSRQSRWMNPTLQQMGTMEGRLTEDDGNEMDLDEDHWTAYEEFMAEMLQTASRAQEQETTEESTDEAMRRLDI